MPNGKPYDHPLTDVLYWGIDLWTPEISRLIHECSALGASQADLELIVSLSRAAKLETPDPADEHAMLLELQHLKVRLEDDARSKGWDVESLHEQARVSFDEARRRPRH